MRILPVSIISITAISFVFAVSAMYFGLLPAHAAETVGGVRYNYIHIKAGSATQNGGITVIDLRNGNFWHLFENGKSEFKGKYNFDALDKAPK